VVGTGKAREKLPSNCEGNEGSKTMPRKKKTPGIFLIQKREKEKKGGNTQDETKNQLQAPLGVQVPSPMRQFTKASPC